MLIKTVLNQLENFKGFVFGKVRLRKRWFEKPTLVVDILPRKGSRPECPVCGRKRSVYDTSRSAREAEYLPLWSYRVVFRFFPRRVNCPWDGFQGEWVPSVNGKEQMTHPYQDLSGSMGPTPLLERGCVRLRDQLGMRLPSRQDGRRLWSCTPLSRGRDTDRN